MMKEVMVSNLEVLRKELEKIETEIGNEYSKILGEHLNKMISKEELYYETALLSLLDAMESLEVTTAILRTATPEILAEMVNTNAKDEEDYTDFSMGLKMEIAKRKIQRSPLGDLLDIFDLMR